MNNSSNNTTITRKVFTAIFYSNQCDDYLPFHFNSLIEADRFEKLNRTYLKLYDIFEESINISESINIY